MLRFLNRILSKKPEEARVEIPVQIAVIGLGAMGQRNLRHIKKSHNFRLVGVQDLRREVAETIARSSRVKAYDDIDSCLDDSESEAIFVCTPHHLLADMGLKVLESGKHLLIEKPMAMNTRSADTLIESSRERDLLISVNYSRVFTDALRSARHLIESGAVGNLIGVETRWNGYKSIGYYYGSRSPVPDDWRLNKSKSGGGMLMMTTCHALHYVPHITGARAETASALIPSSSPFLTDIEDTVQGILKFEDGAVWTILTSSSQRGTQINDTTIWGGNGTIVVNNDRVRYYSTRIINGKRPGIWHVNKTPDSEIYFDRWLDNTALAIRQGRPLEISPESARETLAVIEALYRSAGSRSLVTVGRTSTDI